MNADSLIGRTFDEYRIETPLDAGGMAKVYRALDVKLKRYVALKVIAPNLRDSSDYAQRFEREAQSIARLSQPSVVHIYRFGEVAGTYYIAMQYIEGADLHRLIHDYKNAGEIMSLGDIVRVIQEIGSALDYAHSRDVIHRDVKPSNIMVDGGGHALLTDFGLALLTDVGTHGEISGSPYYVSPEQTISSANALPQSDIYSLGVTLFEVLTGEVPFIGGSPLEVWRRHLSEPAPAPSQFNSVIPPSVDDVVLRALAKDPLDRYQTCADLSTALQAAIAQFPETPRVPFEEVLRPSLVLLPQMVQAHMQAAPLPASQPSSAPVTLIVPPIPAQARTTPVWAPRLLRNPWIQALGLAAILFLIGNLFILGLLILRQSTAPTDEPVSTETANEIIATVPPIALAQTSAPPAISTTLLTVSPTTPPLPALSPTLVPLSAGGASPAPVSPAAVTGESYVLLIARRTDQSLLVVNIGLVTFPLTRLRLVNSGGVVAGTEWQVDQLNNSECVAVLNSDGDGATADVVCTQVGAHVARPGSSTFLGSPFIVYFDYQSVATCDHDNCLVRISAS